MDVQVIQPLENIAKEILIKYGGEYLKVALLKTLLQTLTQLLSTASSLAASDQEPNMSAPPIQSAECERPHNT